jgi:hypothetical protein
MWRDLSKGTAGIAAERERPQSAADAGICTSDSAEAHSLRTLCVAGYTPVTVTPEAAGEEKRAIED